MTHISTPQEQAAEIVKALEASLPEGRTLVAVAGPPGAGKSTVAEEVVAALLAAGRSAALVPMDGFHLDNIILDARGLRDRKGAPETFDLAGFQTLLTRLRQDSEVIIPTFDRDLDAAIAGRQVVTVDQQILVVEGNYLLLDQPGWRDLSQIWDFSVFLDVPFDVLEARLIARWEHHGLDADAARARALGNDIPNARTVVDHTMPCDLVVH